MQPSRAASLTRVESETESELWYCDVCNAAAFPTYDEALEHEKCCGEYIHSTGVVHIKAIHAALYDVRVDSKANLHGRPPKPSDLQKTRHQRHARRRIKRRRAVIRKQKELRNESLRSKQEARNGPSEQQFRAVRHSARLKRSAEKRVEADGKFRLEQCVSAHNKPRWDSVKHYLASNKGFLVSRRCLYPLPALKVLSSRILSLHILCRFPSPRERALSFFHLRPLRQ